MATITTATMRKIRELHNVLSEYGVMCMTEAADLGGLRKASCKGWMRYLVDMGLVVQTDPPEGAPKRVSTIYYTITETPFPDLPIMPGIEDKKPSGGHELSRRVVKAVNMGMGRDYLVAALFGKAGA
ncbi:hypothetical protein [Pseudomonas sp.]|uniref:hypothetical protein n=1 Tax=Pseudomonas sp. TaxID=306 RepID=UPI003FD7A600